jgi:hypothetical protein
LALPRGTAPLAACADRTDALHLVTIRNLPGAELLEPAMDVRAHPNGGAWADLKEGALEEGTQ